MRGFIGALMVATIFFQARAQSSFLPKKAQQKDLWAIATIDSKIGRGFVRFLQNPSRKKKDYPWLVMVSLKYKGALPTKEELDFYGKLEDQMEKAEKQGNLFLAACITLGGRRDWLLYEKKPKDAVSLAKALQAYKPKIEYRYQPDWKEYEAIVKMRQKI